MTLGPFFELSSPIVQKKDGGWVDCEKKRYQKTMNSRDSAITKERQCCDVMLANLHEQRSVLLGGIHLAEAKSHEASVWLTILSWKNLRGRPRAATAARTQEI
jgi:hypothetical protein